MYKKMTSIFNAGKFFLLVGICALFGIGSVFSNYTDKVSNVDIDPLYTVPSAITQYFNPEEQIYIVNFFASWCKPCVNELDDLLALKDGSSISIYGIALNDTKENLDQLFKYIKNPYKKIALDFPIPRLKDIFLDRIPRTMIIYRGEVIYDHLGEVNQKITKKHILPIIQKVQNNILMENKNRGRR